MDVVLGMRGHANIIPFGQNTPFIGLGAHNKVKWFLEEVGLEDNFICLEDENYFNQASHIINKIVDDRNNKCKKQMATMHKAMSRVKDAFMKQVVKRIMDQ